MGRTVPSCSATGWELRATPAHHTIPPWRRRLRWMAVRPSRPAARSLRVRTRPARHHEAAAGADRAGHSSDVSLEPTRDDERTTDAVSPPARVSRERADGEWMQSRFGRRDRRGQSQVTVRFGGSLGLRYALTCVQVTPGTQVIFSGQFDERPLVGGEVPPRGTMPDPSSPLGLRRAATPRRRSRCRQRGRSLRQHLRPQHPRPRRHEGCGVRGALKAVLIGGCSPGRVRPAGVPGPVALRGHASACEPTPRHGGRRAADRL